MGDGERYPISELVRRSGVPAATIHHYLRTGLLPPPRRVAANRFLYDDRHLASLRVIRALRERRRLSLPRIRRLLPELVAMGEAEALAPATWDRMLGRRVRPAMRSGQDRILTAAVSAFARQGYGGVNVDDICRSARVAKGSFYRHWRSKEAVFFAAADAARAEVVFEFDRAMTAGSDARRSPSEALARALEPRLPIFMDLFTRAVQRRSGYAPVARRVFSMLAAEIGQTMGGEQPVAAGALTLALAAAGIFRTALEPSPLSDLAGMTALFPLAAVPPPA